MAQEAWGGEVRLPRWLRRLLRRPEAAGDTPEARAERHRPQPIDPDAVAKNAERASIGAMGDLYHEGRRKRSS
jgi:hypothetical protein